MNDIAELPLRDQPWIKENMVHLHKLWIISLWQIALNIMALICGLSFCVCFGFVFQFTIVGLDVELGLTISGMLIFLMISCALFFKFINHLNFIGISLPKYQQLQTWNIWMLCGCTMLGLFGWLPAIWLFILVNNLQKDAKAHLDRNEPCFIKRPPHRAVFLPPAFTKHSNNESPNKN